jgi:uncharacterized protein YaaN involved in tellurite resistance
MEFDIENTVNQMLFAIRFSVQKDLVEVNTTARQFFEMNKKRYEKLVEYRLAGKIDEQNFKSRLEDEKRMLEVQLNTLTILTKVMAQNAANAAFDVLESAVRTCLKVL